MLVLNVLVLRARRLFKNLRIMVGFCIVLFFITRALMIIHEGLLLLVRVRLGLSWGSGRHCLVLHGRFSDVKWDLVVWSVELPFFISYI